MTKDTDPAKMVSAVFGGVTSILVLLMVLHGPIATNILNVYWPPSTGSAWACGVSRTAMALIAGVVGYLVTIYFLFQPSFAKAFDNWMISLLLWMSPWAGVDPGRLLHRAARAGSTWPSSTGSPSASAYGDVNWGAIVAFVGGPGRGLVGARTAWCPRCRGRSRPSCSPART